jgi:hypothetical protein
MSVEFVSSVIYGYNLSNKCVELDFDGINELVECLENVGFDIIYDGYCGEFLYAGIELSRACCYEEASTNITQKFADAHAELNRLIAQAPIDLLNQLPLREAPATYHLCYAE